MKTPCNVIRDLLPLYHDGICSPESRQLVDEHMAECTDCRAELERMNAPLPTAHPQVEERTVVEAASSAWKRGRRRAFSKGFVLAAVLVALVCGLVALWAWCNRSPLEVTGRIVETQVNNTTGDVTYVVYTTRGEEIGLLLGEETRVISYFDAYTDQAFREGEINDALRIDAELGGTKETIRNQDGEKIPAYPAQLVEINAYQQPDPILLRDGTQVEVWDLSYAVLYALPQGPELLEIDTYTPEDSLVGDTDGLEQTSQEAQDKILAYYQAQGTLYDQQKELEQAYQECLQWKGSTPFPTRKLHQITNITAYSPSVLYFLTTVDRYTDDGQLYVERHTAAFRRDTGEQVDYQELFTCTPDQLIQALLDQSETTDPTLRQEMEQAFDINNIDFSLENFSVWYEAGTLPSQESTYGLVFDYDDDILALIQPWAVPITATSPSPSPTLQP